MRKYPLYTVGGVQYSGGSDESFASHKSQVIVVTRLFSFPLPDSNGFALRILAQ